MLLIFFISMILLVAQLIVGVFSWSTRLGLKYKYRFALSEQIEPSELLEKYSKKFKKVVFKADALDEPAYAEDNYLLVDKKSLYKRDLFTNFYVIYQLLLTQVENEYLRYINKYTNLLFPISLAFLIMGIFIQSDLQIYLLLVGLIVQIITIFLSICSFP